MGLFAGEAVTISTEERLDLQISRRYSTLQLREWFRLTEWLCSIPDKSGSGVISKTWLHELMQTTSQTPSSDVQSPVSCGFLLQWFVSSRLLTLVVASNQAGSSSSMLLQLRYLRTHYDQIFINADLVKRPMQIDRRH
jgi:hypothetical protein